MSKLSDSNGTKEDSSANTEDIVKKISETMPVISIRTEAGMGFIDEPVARHVAEDIASWTPGYVIPPEPYYVDCSISVISSDSNFEFSDAGAQVKVRGNWTTSYPKKPLRIKFTEKRNLLGLNNGREFKNWLLLAEYKDASMLRDKVAFQISNAFLKEDGLYASDAELVTVFVNDDYRGIYLLVEAQEIKKDRVNATGVKKDYTGTDIGYFLEMDGYYMSENPLNRFHVSYNDNAPLVPFDGNGGSGKTMKCLPSVGEWNKKDLGFTIKSDINSAEQNEFIANFVENTYRIMYEAAYNEDSYVFDDTYSAITKTDSITPREAVERVVNINALVDMYIISELTCDADLYWSSFYMSVDFGPGGDRKLTFQAPWDFDSGLGNKNRCVDGTGYYAANIIPDVNGDTDYGWQYNTINPWLAVLAYEDWFREIVESKWKKAVEGKVFENAYEMIDSDSSRLKDEFTRNYKKWNNIIRNEDFVGELSARARGCVTQGDGARYLSEWLHSRVDFLNGEWLKK